MKRTTGAILFLALLLLNSCRKDDPVDAAGTPVFYITGTLGSSSVNIQAGNDGYFMHTSYSSDTNDVYTFSGLLAQENCTAGCPNSFQFLIRDYAQHTLVNTDIDSAITATQYFFLDSSGSQANSNTIAFTSDPHGDQVLSYYWSFGDGDSSLAANPVHTYPQAGSYNVCCTINYMNNNVFCSSSICSIVEVGAVPCMDVDISSTPLGVDSFFGADSVNFTAVVTGGNSPYTYAWNFGDSSSGTGSPVNHTYQMSGEYLVSLSVSDAQGCTIQRLRNVASTGSTGCLTNFNWTPVIASALDFSKVEVKWFDSAGNEYSSATGIQNSSSSFQILSVENYDQNSSGQRTKKIHARITCTLYGASSNLQLTNADVVFAVAYP